MVTKPRVMALCLNGVGQLTASGYLGSLQERAAKAAGDALGNGASALMALVVGQIAGFESSWLTDRESASRIVQRNGRNPHLKSVARVRKLAREHGWIDCVRVFPGHKPPGARFTSTGGTTSKRVNFRGLGTRDPLTRGEKRKLRRRAQSVEGGSACVSEPADLTPSVTPPAPDRPRHTTPPPNRSELYARPKDPASMDPLAAVLAEATANMEAKWQRDQDREDLRMMRGVVREAKPPKPPD